MAEGGNELALELKVLELKKAQIFDCIQKLYDASKAQKPDASFKKKVGCVDQLFTEYTMLCERANVLGLKINPEKKISFSDLDTMQEMVSMIKYTHGLILAALQQQSQSASGSKVATELPSVVKEPAMKLPPLEIPFFNALQQQSQSASGSKVATELPSVVKEPAMKLPPLEIPFFNGDLSKWPMFYEIFKANVHDSQLSEAHKLQYLLSKLGGTAQNVCAGIPPTAENYLVIFNALVEKYQDKRNLAHIYLEKMFKFNQVKSSQQLSTFVDYFAANVAALEALKIDDLGQFLLFYIACQKLDSESRRRFETSLKNEEFPTFSKLLEFVKQEAKASSRVQPLSSSTDSHGKYVPPHARSSKPAGPKFNHSFFVNKDGCPVCQRAHVMSKCKVFLEKTPKERYDLVKKNMLCVNCFGTGHQAYLCGEPRCSECHLNHNTLLHFGSMEQSNKPIGKTPIKSSNSQEKAANVKSCNTQEEVSNNIVSSVCSQSSVLLSTVKLGSTDQFGNLVKLRFLLDSGSMCNIITDQAVEKLGLTMSPSLENITGIGSDSKPVRGEVKFNFHSCLDNRMNFNIRALVVSDIVDKLPIQPVDFSVLNYLHNLPLADNDFMNPGVIDGILGSPIFPYLLDHTVKTVFGKKDQPVAMGTKLGYVLMGNAPILQKPVNKQFCMFQKTSVNFDDKLSKFWELDNVKDALLSDKYSPDEKECEQHYSDTVVRDETGRYVVTLPFKEDPSELGDSHHTAVKRFSGLERKFKVNVEFANQYSKAMSEMVENGFMVKALNQKDKSGYFIPHHAVIRPESASTKLRVVYDGSAKTNSGKSLNDILHSGPTLYNELFMILVNFRLFPFVLIGDITKMFLQIKMDPKDWKYQRLLWRNSPDQPLEVFELTVVIFGLRSSPFLAQRTVKQLIHDESKYFPRAEKIQDSLYMDDCVISFLTEEDGKLFYHDVVNLFKKGGFTFTKWGSNSQNILEDIPVEDQIGVWNHDSLNCKVLGIHWNGTTDNFEFRVNQKPTQCTKRSILSSILTMFDPLGSASTYNIVC
ncbi:uncharacterized protein LOC103512857 [Diaphorina citri]|uniref:Uncharacterized protein LOC103512857 n=1 Tax=Diaphorina citri TaxID=121845 RepID=A0A1S3D744_DIACI|nr:uncharacterized protein LOC103512857 [Diaphorina citri]